MYVVYHSSSLFGQTRKWNEVIPSLAAMVEAAHVARAKRGLTMKA